MDMIIWVLFGVASLFIGLVSVEYDISNGCNEHAGVAGFVICMIAFTVCVAGGICENDESNAHIINYEIELDDGEVLDAHEYSSNKSALVHIIYITDDGERQDRYVTPQMIVKIISVPPYIKG